MKFFLLCMLLVVAQFSVAGQILSGRVTTTNNAPVPYATIYIHETSSGVITDADGNFQISLSPGIYTVEARFLGYETQIKKIEITASGKTESFRLAEKIQNLQEITVRPSGEDPAYAVMRHAIARAPYHLYQVETYTCDTYLKGSAKIESIPALLTMMTKDKKLKLLLGRLFVVESQNELTFQSPSRYVQRVLAYKSSIPKEIEPKGGIRVVTSNIYAAKYGDYVSPLSPQAFQYYRFSLADIFPGGNHQINKIKITPKLRNASLYSGYVYIVEGDWSVFALDLSVTQAGTVVYDKVNYQEVQPGVFLPITYNMKTDINTMGIKGFARYYASVKYKNIRLSASAQTKPAVAKQSESVLPQTKRRRQAQEVMAKLAAKEKLTTADALRMARVSSQLLEPEAVGKRRRSLEIRDTALVKLQVDSLAALRDSAYWQSVRQVPLLQDEASSFRGIDSISVPKSLRATDDGLVLTLDEAGISKGNLLKGGRLALGDSVFLRYSGLVKGLIKEYNFVDGWWLGQRLSLSLPFAKTGRLSVTPWVYYVTGRKCANWNAELKLDYSPLLRGRFSIAGGSSSADIQGETGTSRSLNTYSTLLRGNNVIRFYKSNSIHVSNRIDIANGITLTMGGGYDNRSLLVNTTTAHLFGRGLHPNVPDDAYAAAFPGHTAATVFTSLAYTPLMRYRIVDGRKITAGSDYPTFTAAFQMAFRVNDKPQQSEYQRLTIGANHSVRLDIWSILKYSVSAGGYLSDKKLFAPDFYYPRTSPLSVTYHSFDNSFALLPDYSYSTGKWAEAHVGWQSDYLLLKRLPFMQKYIFNEALHLKCLYMSATSKPYLEAGYTIGLLDMMRGGVFTSFVGKEYQQAGIRISIPLAALMGL